MSPSFVVLPYCFDTHLALPSFQTIVEARPQLPLGFYVEHEGPPCMPAHHSHPSAVAAAVS